VKMEKKEGEEGKKSAKVEVPNNSDPMCREV
jgi:hypothetical protein